MLHRLTACAALLLLAACGDREAKPAAAAPQVAPAAISAPDPLSVRPTGVGPLEAGTPFDEAVIARAFPGATVERAFMHYGGKGEATPVLNVLAGGTQTLQVTGDARGGIGEITVTGGDYVAPGGERLMTPWSRTTLSIDDCGMGDGPTLHALVCRKKGAPEINYVIGIPGWTSGEPPSAEVLAEEAFLREMVWTAPPSAP